MCLNVDYAAALFEGKVQLHMVSHLWRFFFNDLINLSETIVLQVRGCLTSRGC